MQQNTQIKPFSLDRLNTKFIRKGIVYSMHHRSQWIHHIPALLVCLEIISAHNFHCIVIAANHSIFGVEQSWMHSRKLVYITYSEYYTTINVVFIHGSMFWMCCVWSEGVCIENTMVQRGIMDIICMWYEWLSGFHDFHIKWGMDMQQATISSFPHATNINSNGHSKSIKLIEVKLTTIKLYMIPLIN